METPMPLEHDDLSWNRFRRIRTSLLVIPAKAGIQPIAEFARILDPRFRGVDKGTGNIRGRHAMERRRSPGGIQERMP